MSTVILVLILAALAPVLIGTGALAFLVCLALITQPPTD